MSSPRSPFRRVVATTGIATLALIGAVALPQAAIAAPTTFHVTNLTDANPGSLRDAVSQANANPGLDTIVFDVPGTVTLLSGIAITDGVIIDGGGGAGSTINRSFDGDVLTVNLAGGTPTVDRVFETNFVNMNGAGGLGRAINVLPAVPLGSMALKNATIASFDGADRGGAVRVEGLSGGFTVDTMTFSESTAVGTGSSDNGGAISLDSVGGPIQVTNTVFDGNEGHRGGGLAILSSPSAAVTVTDTQFTSNEATGTEGGGLYLATTGNLTLSGVDFTDNGANDNGGALYVYGAPTVTITGSEFARNSTTANGLGGSIYFDRVVGTASINTSDFIDNSTPGRGGAIAAGVVGAITSLRINDSTFADNTAAEGGAVFLVQYTADSWIQNSVFTGNTATSSVGTGGYGGAVSFDTQLGTVPAPFTITATTFEGNTAVRTGGAAGAGAGGAIAALGIDSTLTIEDSTFVDNTLGPYPGAIGSSIWVDEITGTFDLINSTVSGSDYWEIHVESAGDGSFVSFSHSTFTTDTALSFGQFAGASVTHVIFDSRPTAFPISGVDIGVQWSLFRAADDPAQIISSNTRFDVPNMILGPLQNNGGPTETRLPLPGSPAIDKGDPALVFHPVYDQREAGFDRVVNQIVDIGAVEASKSLAPTGASINPVIPIAGGVFLLLGVGAIILARRRKGGHDAG